MIMLICLEQRKLEVTKSGSLKSFDVLLTMFFTWIESISSSHLYNIQVILGTARTMNRTEAGYYKLMNHFETEYPTLLWN